MTLTEEQLEAIRDVSDLPRAIGCTQCHSYIQEHYGNQFAILRAMIDSSDHIVEPDELIGFDLEKVRAVLEEAIDRMSLTVSDEDGFVWEADPEQTVILQEILDRIGRYTNNDYLDLQYQLDSAEAEIERLRGYEIAARDLSADLTKVAGDRDDQAARIQELEAVLKEADQYRRESLDRIMEIANQRDNLEILNDELIENGNGLRARAQKAEARIKELEDAHKRSGVKYAKIINELRSSVYANMPGLKKQWDEILNTPANGKIGPDARPRSWQITEERMRAIRLSEELAWDCKVVDVLRAMLQEAGI